MTWALYRSPKLDKPNTRFVVKQEGVSNVFLTVFDYFLGGQWKLGGWEAPEGVKPPNPPTNRALDKPCSVFNNLNLMSSQQITITPYKAISMEHAHFDQSFFSSWIVINYLIRMFLNFSMNSNFFTRTSIWCICDISCRLFYSLMSKLEIIIKGMENKERQLEKASECQESQFAQWSGAQPGKYARGCSDICQPKSVISMVDDGERFQRSRMRLGDLGERRKLPQRGLGRSPSLQRIWWHLRLNWTCFWPIVSKKCTIASVLIYGKNPTWKSKLILFNSILSSFEQHACDKQEMKRSVKMWNGKCDIWGRF